MINEKKNTYIIYKYIYLYIYLTIVMLRYKRRVDVVQRVGNQRYLISCYSSFWYLPTFSTLWYDTFFYKVRNTFFSKTRIAFNQRKIEHEVYNSW